MTAVMRPLFACWNEVAARLHNSRTIALFLDFDGTLVDIRPRPELVRVRPAVRRALAALAGSRRFRVWVISARRRADIQARVRAAAVRYLGLYGWERTSIVPAPSGPIVQLRAVLTGALPAHPALWIEDKQHTLAVHYRGAPEPVWRLAEERLCRAVKPWRGCLRIAPGKAVWEVLPRDLGDKGAAVRRELAALPRPLLPVYIGDDLSDEPAFASVAQGIAVRVGPARRTRARYRLSSALQVLQFLERLQVQFL